MRKLALSRALAVLAAACLTTGFSMMFASSAVAQTPSATPSAATSPTPTATSSSPSGGGLPAPLNTVIPSSASPSPSATGSAPATNPGGNNTSVLGQTIPKTGADRALPLMIAGVLLALTSLAVRRVIVRRSS